jgi:hypothetical protein
MRRPVILSRLFVLLPLAGAMMLATVASGQNCPASPIPNCGYWTLSYYLDVNGCPKYYCSPPEQGMNPYVAAPACPSGYYAFPTIGGSGVSGWQCLAIPGFPKVPVTPPVETPGSTPTPTAPAPVVTPDPTPEEPKDDPCAKWREGMRGRTPANLAGTVRGGGPPKPPPPWRNPVTGLPFGTPGNSGPNVVQPTDAELQALATRARIRGDLAPHIAEANRVLAEEAAALNKAKATFNAVTESGSVLDNDLVFNKNPGFFGGAAGRIGLGVAIGFGLGYLQDRIFGELTGQSMFEAWSDAFDAAFMPEECKGA